MTNGEALSSPVTPMKNKAPSSRPMGDKERGCRGETKNSGTINGRQRAQEINLPRPCPSASSAPTKNRTVDAGRVFFRTYFFQSSAPFFSA